MANTQRYKPVGPWSTYYSWESDDGYEVVIEVADLKERFTERTYVDGAFRVIFRRWPDGHVKPRQKPFYGEMAWSESRNYAEDQIHKLKMALR